MRVRAQATTAQTEAATLYRQAFAVLPAANTPEDRILSRWWAVPLDDRVKTFLASKQPALNQFRQAAKLPRAAWNTNQDPAAVAQVTREARRLFYLVMLNARSLPGTNQNAQAFDDIAGVFALSRHLGCEPVLLLKLSEHSLRATAIPSAAELLPEATPTARDAFAKQLASLPPSASLGDAMRNEGKTVVRQMNDLAAKPAETGVAELEKAAKSNRDVDLAALKALWTDEARRREAIAGLAAHFEAAAVLVDEPSGAAGDAAAERYRAQRADAGVLAILVVPDAALTRQNRIQDEVNFAMLRAAAAILSRGPEAVAEFKDPTNGEPFQYAKRQGGFEIISSYAPRKRPLTLYVGRREIR